MAPQTKAIAQSESKGRFMERLGLDEANEDHKKVYALMKAEAVEARRHLTANLEDHESCANASIGQIGEAAIHREIIRMYKGARPETRQIYDLGQDLLGPAEENWIIRWMIWHVFRYRDIRNRRNTPTAKSAAKMTPTLRDSEGTSVSGNPTAQAAAQSLSQMWDPVRETWVEL
ncbi:hypothetical protein K431DRAFT_304354 [Polychaeton citri CBS 116435]|uniref:Uncharacterized protein n=1 Tax=Polychaeton citri CBS 116435 TaxID=1314669 RepID=A0A9P4Q8G0_9PEZI|nr:hypothetical protein K431DRAFT_304354 [Polychaeton citri CBS 116435]